MIIAIPPKEKIGKQKEKRIRDKREERTDRRDSIKIFLNLFKSSKILKESKEDSQFLSKY